MTDPKRLMCVWLIYGNPQEADGAVSYHRGGAYLMEFGASSGDVVERFIKDSRKEDGVDYLGAKVERVGFYGIVELP